MSKEAEIHAKGTGRRSFLHQTAQSFLNENDIETKAQNCLNNMAWIVDASCDFILQSLGDNTADVWSIDRMRNEFWELLNEPCSLLTSLEVNFIYRAIQRQKEKLTKDLLQQLMLEVKKLAIMWDIIDGTSGDEVYERLIVDFEALQHQIHFDAFDTDLPSYVKTEDCFEVMVKASYLRLTLLHLFFLTYWSDASVKGMSLLWKNWF